MSSLNIGLILLSCVFHTAWNVLTQTSRNSRYLSGLKGVWIMLMGILCHFVLDYSSLPRDIWLWVALSGILHGLYILSLSKAYESQDISYVYPIARSAPVIVPLFAWIFLGERLDFISFLAIGVIFIAVYILHFDGHLIRGFRNLWDAVMHKDLRWSFITLGLVVMYSVVDKAGMEVFFRHRPEQEFTNGLTFFFLESFFGFTLCNLYLFSTSPAGEIIQVWRQEWVRGIVAGIATMGSYGLICVVLQFEPVSQVVAVRQTSVLMVVAWGAWRLGEPFGKQRLLAAALTVAGVALMGWNHS